MLIVLTQELLILVKSMQAITQTQHANSQKPTRWCHTRAEGFTLVEVMIAIMVIGLGLTSATICLRVGMLQTDTARATTYVTQVLQDEAELIRLLKWSEIEALSESENFAASDSIEYSEINPDRFTFTREVSDVNDESGLKEIRLKAEWTGISQDTHQLNTVFYYAENGMHDYYYGSE
jgi:prepilin-type N-terminal cleavage/methylation domain-containing protein